MNPPRWLINPSDPDQDQILARELGTSHILAALMRNRGFLAKEDALAYLKPKLSSIEEPTALLDMAKAAERVKDAIRRQERIIVYGDYDVDGMTGTVVLKNFLRLAGGRAESYIPNRLKDGYSFNDEAIDGFLKAAEPPSLIITVDHGTSAKSGIDRLKAAGVDVIVTDHHHPPPTLPESAFAIVNPNRPDCQSRFKSLCGAAVAFKLAWASAQALSGSQKVTPEFRAYLLDAMSLVALATVTDVVPLRDENRVLCFHGLQALTSTTNPGLLALLRQSRLKGQVVRAVHVGYRLGPRLNAAGRMGIAETAIELLTATDPARAEELAKTLEDANERRRSLEAEMLREALSMPEVTGFRGGHGICIGRVGWHAGVIGIIAARLVDRLQVPVVVCALSGDQGRGSARTPKGINLANVLAECSQHLETSGGHAAAAGCTVTERSFLGFQKAFIEETRRAMESRTDVSELRIDLEIPFRSIRPALIEELELLAPHGEGNPPALFCTRGAEVIGTPRLLGKDQSHVGFFVRHGDQSFRAVAFGRPDLAEKLRQGSRRIDLAYRLKFDSYLDPGAVELEIVDVRTAASEQASAVRT